MTVAFNPDYLADGVEAATATRWCSRRSTP